MSFFVFGSLGIFQIFRAAPHFARISHQCLTHSCKGSIDDGRSPSVLLGISPRICKWLIMTVETEWIPDGCACLLSSAVAIHDGTGEKTKRSTFGDR